MDSGLVWDMAPLYKWILPNWYNSYSAGCITVLSAIALAYGATLLNVCRTGDTLLVLSTVSRNN
jgi:hypothetical protein